MAQPAMRAFSGFVSWLQSHKAAGIIIGLGVLLGWVAIANISAYLHKFSKQDYDRLTTMAQHVLATTSGASVEVKRECSYERPGEFASLRLYCSVTMVTYLRYESDAYAVRAASTLEQNITMEFGKTLFGFSSFYQRPRDGSDTSTVLLRGFPSRSQCNFYIATNRNAKNVLTFPEKSEDDLIALSFECAAEAREAYFPVTYRQD